MISRDRSLNLTALDVQVFTCSFISYWMSFCFRLALSSALVDGISNRIGFLSAVTWTMRNKIVLCDDNYIRSKDI